MVSAVLVVVMTCCGGCGNILEGGGCQSTADDWYGTTGLGALFW